LLSIMIAHRLAESPDRLEPGAIAKPADIG
jgi:hypothetical protein